MIWFVFAACTVFWIYQKIKKKTIREYPLEEQITPEATTKEQWENIRKLLEKRMINSGVFIPEKIPLLLEMMKSNFNHIDDLTCLQSILNDNEYLSLKGKNELGLNSRKKYSKKFIEFIEPSACKTICPKNEFTAMYYDSWHRVKRKNKLIKLKNIGIKKIKILNCGGCKKIEHAKKTYNIEETPELPLDDCDVDFCRCLYIIDDNTESLNV